jgi:hypothetical protein
VRGCAIVGGGEVNEIMVGVYNDARQCASLCLGGVLLKAHCSVRNVRI